MRQRALLTIYPSYFILKSLFENFSFQKATLDLREKQGFRLAFPKPFLKLTEF